MPETEILWSRNPSMNPSKNRGVLHTTADGAVDPKVFRLLIPSPHDIDAEVAQGHEAW